MNTKSIRDDEFQCESCGNIFDVEDGIKPDGKKGALYCTGCAIDKSRKGSMASTDGTTKKTRNGASGA